MKAMPSQAPMALAGMSRLYGQLSWSEIQAAPPSAAPTPMEVPKPLIARLTTPGRTVRSGAGDGLDDTRRRGLGDRRWGCGLAHRRRARRGAPT